ncbi:putative transcriptional regulator [Mycobacteroides abscessus subsp. abscessus]|uniref:XRE family transcriptional regulator n=1 Tax=Dermabacter vaginalis TaxID=1630135 RepID=A0ABX6A3V9_9MICO|nr:XRE family transcriptional regulator [Dermabacter vaginalis]SHW95877.1 putative transcriptional regulator [Mycobacteroides abscessus subsp. abscessus]
MQVYLSRTDVAERIGVQVATLSRYRLPEPDAQIGILKRPTSGWLPETIDRWNAERPGSGNWTRGESRA